MTPRHTTAKCKPVQYCTGRPQVLRTAPGGICAANSSQVIGLSGGPHSAGQAPADPVVPVVVAAVVVVVGSPVNASVVEQMSQPVQSHSLESCSHDAW